MDDEIVHHLKSWEPRKYRFSPHHLGEGEGFLEGGRQNKCPKLLFLAYSFPPVNMVASVRTWNIAKHLSRLGWEVQVVTPNPLLWRFTDDHEKVEGNLKLEGIQRIPTGYAWRCLLPDCFKCWNTGLGWICGGICRSIARKFGIEMEIGWLKACVQACKSLTQDQVDVILASGPPFVSFKVAKLISEKFGKPYVLDYRDPWSNNPHSNRPFTPSQIQLEAKLLKDSAAVTIVSPSWASEMEHRFHVKAKLHVVTNGFDSEVFAGVMPNRFDHFAIVYCGTFYPPKRVITPVMAALKLLKEALDSAKSPKWIFHYYGKDEKHVLDEAIKFNVREHVILHGKVSRSQALSAVRGASISVVITSVAKEANIADKGIIPGKLFEALGLRTPTLVISPPESDIEAITGNSGMIRCFRANNTEGIVDFLIERMKGVLFETGNFDSYSWQSIGWRFSEILKAVLVR